MTRAIVFILRTSSDQTVEYSTHTSLLYTSDCTNINEICIAFFMMIQGLHDDTRATQSVAYAPEWEAVCGYMEDKA
jgi:ABC-type sulfate/molybdate transport systems ATPase subunit